MISRRNFLFTTAIGIASASCLGPFVISAGAAELFPKKKKRVVVAGGGFGGSTVARYLKIFDPQLDVILIEPREKFISCPSSNLVIGGLRKMSQLTYTYDNLAKKHGIRIVRDSVAAIDPISKYVEVSNGKIAYDRLVVSPGIDFDYHSIEGMDETAQSLFPHAWKAGAQTEQLARELFAMKQGGTYVLTVPETPYRCPPGPYERACMVANYIKRTGKGGKLIILDANADVTSKGKLFKAAWNDYYKDIIEYRPDISIKKIDIGKRILTTDKGDLAGDIINIIPDQKAGKLAFDTGLAAKGRRWAATSPITFESTVHKGIHVIGDAVDPDVIGSMPKSGFIANSMGKAAAAAIISMLAGNEPPYPTLENACYSQVNETESIYVTGVFHYSPQTGKIAGVKAAGGVSPSRLERYTKHYHDWETSIIKDTLG